MTRIPAHFFNEPRNRAYLEEDGRTEDLPLVHVSKDTDVNYPELKAFVLQALSQLEPSGMFNNPQMHPFGTFEDKGREEALTDCLEEHLVETGLLDSSTGLRSGIIIQNGDYIGFVVLRLPEKEDCPTLDGILLLPPFFNNPTIRQLTDNQLQVLS